VRTGSLLSDIRKLWQGTLILTRPCRVREQIGAVLPSGQADLESYGHMVLATPDFVARLQAGAAMKEANRNPYFGGSAQGYTDYPLLSA